MVPSLHACSPCWVLPSARAVTKWGKMWKKPFTGASLTRISSFTSGRDKRLAAPRLVSCRSWVSHRGAVPIQNPHRTLTWLRWQKTNFVARGLHVAVSPQWICARLAARTSFIPIAGMETARGAWRRSSEFDLKTYANLARCTPASSLSKRRAGRLPIDSIGFWSPPGRAHECGPRRQPWGERRAHAPGKPQEGRSGYPIFADLLSPLRGSACSLCAAIARQLPWATFLRR